MLYRCRQVVDRGLHLSTDEIGDKRRRATIGHMKHVDACHHLEQLTGHMRGRADTERCQGHLTGVGFSVSDQFRNCLNGNRWMDLKDQRRTDQASDHDDVTNEIEIELLKERNVDRIRRTGSKQRVAITRRPHYRLDREIGRSARPVLDDKLLA